MLRGRNLNSDMVRLQDRTPEVSTVVNKRWRVQVVTLGLRTMNRNCSRIWTELSLVLP